MPTPRRAFLKALFAAAASASVLKTKLASASSAVNGKDVLFIEQGRILANLCASKAGDPAIKVHVSHMLDGLLQDMMRAYPVLPSRQARLDLLATPRNVNLMSDAALEDASSTLIPLVIIRELVQRHPSMIDHARMDHIMPFALRYCRKADLLPTSSTRRLAA